MAQDYKKPLVALDGKWREMTDDERRDALQLLKVAFDKIVADLKVDIDRTFAEYGIPLVIELEPRFARILREDRAAKIRSLTTATDDLTSLFE